MLLGGLLLTALAGCGGGQSSPNTVPIDLYGIWKLTRISGGITGSNNTPSSTETIAFRTNNTATITRDGTETTGPFTSKREQTNLQTTPLLILTLPGGTKRAMTTKTSTTLVLSEYNISDVQQFEYTRQNL